VSEEENKEAARVLSSALRAQMWGGNVAMAKDAWKNQPNYKIGGGTLNEYEFNQQHGALTEQEHAHLPGQSQGQTGDVSVELSSGENDPNESPEAQRIHRMMEAAREKVARRGGGQKASGAKKPAAAKKAVKKSAAKSATKSAAKSGAKSSAKKSGAGKGVAKRASGAKRAVAKKGGAKKFAGAKKRGARRR
jgi:hypothetical protein